MAFNIGINVIETEGPAAPAIAGAPTSVAGLILRSRRGPTDRAVRVSNFRQFTSRFGSYHRDFVGAYCVDGFFLNGGREAYIARVVGDNSETASVTLKDRTGNNTLTVTAGYRGEPEVGAWGNDLYVDIQDNPEFFTPLLTTRVGNQPARLQGNPLSGSVDLSSFSGTQPRTLTLTVDGAANPLTVNFGQLPVPGNAPARDIVDAINAQVGQRLIASVESDGILLVSRTKGSTSQIEILSGIYEETRDRLGFPNGNTSAEGETPQPARLLGNALIDSINLSDRTLILSVDGGAAITIDFNTLTDPTAAGAQDIVDAINAGAGTQVTAAVVEESRIQLTSNTTGTTSQIDISTSDDETLNLLGFAADNRTDAGEGNAQLQGTSLTEPIDLSVPAGSPLRILTLLVDDSSTPLTITLPNSATASVNDVVTAINAQAEGQVTAAAVSGGIQLTSSTTGATSRIEVVVDDTPERLGFPSDNRTESGAPIPDSVSYDHVRVESIVGFQVGDWVRLSDGITQNWHQIVELIEQNDAAGNPEFFVRWEEPDPSEQNEYRIEDGATLSTCEFDLGILLQSPADPEPQSVETWEQLSLDPNHPNYAPLRVNESFSGSSYVVLEDLSPDTFEGRDVPEPGRGIRLGIAPVTSNLTRVEGTDGDPPSTGDYRDALSRFDTIPIQLLVITEDLPDGVLKAATRAAIDYCQNEEKKGDCMFVGHTPLNRDATGAKAFGRDFRASKVFGALYWPWITVTDPIGVGSNPTKEIPPTGHVLGVYARIDQTRGVWKAPAGNEAVVRGALAVKYDITDVDHTDLVKNGSVNGIRRIPGAGIAIDASRTLSTDTRWLYVNVRLLFNFVKASLRDGLRWVKQEPNRETLWNKIKFNTVTPFLLGLHQAGAFGPGTPGEVFTVIVGSENNPPDQIVLGNLTIEVYFFPGRPAETIIIRIGQQDSGATASEQ